MTVIAQFDLDVVASQAVALPSPAGRHIATVQQFNGSEVWHVYEMAPT